MGPPDWRDREINNLSKLNINNYKDLHVMQVLLESFGCPATNLHLQYDLHSPNVKSDTALNPHGHIGCAIVYIVCICM